MIELQDIFREFKDEYLEKYKTTHHIEKVINCIINCRTAILGGHIDVCEECGHLEISYNSCGNRHCNKCQTMEKEKWLFARREELLETGYFHVVFTIPAELNCLMFQNKRILYNILFKASAETMQELAADKKYLGGQIGITSVLHTWGQNLDFHPHIHQIIPAGAINSLSKWNESGKKFFIPVKVIGKKFRGKFLYYLRQLYGKLHLSGSIAHLNNPVEFMNLVDSMYHKKWVVYCKAPFKSSKHCLDYLGRYTHRVAISNNRIISCEKGMVTFKYRDYKDGSKQKIMSLTGIEFMRRVLLHVLPRGFVKVRYYGFVSSRNKKTRLRLAQKLTNSKLCPIIRQKPNVHDLMLKIIGRDITKCKLCGGLIKSRASPDDCNLTVNSTSPLK